MRALLALALAMLFAALFAATPSAAAHTCDRTADCGPCPDGPGTHDHRWVEGASRKMCTHETRTVPSTGVTLAALGATVAALAGRR